MIAYSSAATSSRRLCSFTVETYSTIADEATCLRARLADATALCARSKRLELAALCLSPKSPAAKRSNPTPPPSRDAIRRRILESLDPPPPPRPLNPTAAGGGDGGKGYTQLEQQVVDLKARHHNVLLMVEVGYRYRFFGEDAAIATTVLGIVTHPDCSFLTASIPTFCLSFHVGRLVAAGHKVGVVRQIETAAVKAAAGGAGGAPFAWGLSAVYTRATRATIEAAAGELEGGDAAPEEGSSYLVCIVGNLSTSAGTIASAGERLMAGDFGIWPLSLAWYICLPHFLG